MLLSVFVISDPPDEVANLITYPRDVEKSSFGASHENLILPYPKSSTTKPETLDEGVLFLFSKSVL